MNLKEFNAEARARAGDNFVMKQKFPRYVATRQDGTLIGVYIAPHTADGQKVEASVEWASVDEPTANPANNEPATEPTVPAETEPSGENQPESGDKSPDPAADQGDPGDETDQSDLAADTAEGGRADAAS